VTGDQPAVPEDVMRDIVAEVVAERSLTADQADAVNDILHDYYMQLKYDHSEAVGLIMQATGLPIAAADWLLCHDQPAEPGPLPPEAFR
jgi:hypothetical protein